MTVCALIAQANEWNGKEVIVSGLLQSQPHGSILLARNCEKRSGKQEINVERSLEHPLPSELASAQAKLLKRYPFRPIKVTIRGLFEVAGVGECFGGGCEPFQLSAAEILCITEDQKR